MKAIILSVDIGSSSLKAAYIDQDGKLLAYARESYADMKAQGTAAWERAFALSLEKLRALAPGFAPDAVCISGNGPTLVPVKANNGNLTPLYWYGNKKPLSAKNEKAASSFFLSHVAWFMENAPNEYEKVKYFFSSHEWLAARLGAEAFTALPSLSYEPYYWDEEQCGLCGIEMGKFPPFIKMGSAAGRVSAEAAFLFGSNMNLKSGIPIIAGGPDFITALIGTGVQKPGDVCDRAGSSEGINVCGDKPVKTDGLRVLPHAIEGLWNISVLIPSSGRLFEEYRLDSGQQNRPYEDLLAELIPSWIIAPCSPLPTASFKLNKGRKVLCAMGFAVRSALETLGNAGLLVKEMRLSGGQGRNAGWNQLKADLTGVSLLVPEIPDGELAGNAVLAAAALDGVSVEEAANRMIRIREVYSPLNPEYWEEKFSQKKSYKNTSNFRSAVQRRKEY